MPLGAWMHQQSAADWLSSRKYGYIAHEMGTGKSRTLLMAASGLLRLLIVCPISVGRAWVKQAGLYDRERRVCLAVDGPSKRRAAAIAEALKDPSPVAVVVNYDAVWRGDIAEAIQSQQWQMIALDESHRIKSHTAKSTKYLTRLAETQPDAVRVCLSGTPTPRDILDWYSQFRFLDQTLIGGSFSQFRDRVAYMSSGPQRWVTGFRPAESARLASILDPHIHRVTSDQVLTLPEAVHQTLPVRLGPETRRFYDELEEEMVAKLEDGGIVSVENRMVSVGRLQLAACGYTREDGSDSFRRVYGQPDKRLALREFLADFPASEPLCVFVKYRCDLDEVAEEVAASGRTSRELSGRKKQLESWQAGEASVLVVQQQAGGVGIDLTRSSYMVFYSISHSLGDYEQSLARIRRPGQAKCCRYYHFVAEGTVDEDVYAAISEKRDIVESVLNRLQRRVTA